MRVSLPYRELHILLSCAGITIKEYANIKSVFDINALAVYNTEECIRLIAAKLPETGAKLYAAEKEYREQSQAVKRLGITVSVAGDGTFPARLENFEDAPYVLYLMGNTDLLKNRLVTVVGSRRCTRYGEVQTELIVKGLCNHGLDIVSGLAEGIDSIAARTALKYREKAVCVIAGGFENIYPRSNCQLFKQHCEYGLAVSEYPPLCRPARYMFPMRNRIMAYMSEAVVLTEAGERSGALITANIAAANGIDLFILPGNVNSDASRGCNNLLKETTAALITDYRDVLFGMGITPAEMKKDKRQKALGALTDAERDILRLLNRGALHFDEITAGAEVSAAYAATLMSVLEIKGFIEKLPGNMYALSAEYSG